MSILLIALALDASLFVQPSLLWISTPIKALIMVPLLIFATALFLRKSTYVNLDLMVIVGLLFLFVSYSFLSAFPSDSFSRAIRQAFLVLIYLSTFYVLLAGSFQRKNFVFIATVCLLILAPTTLFLRFNPVIEHLVQAGGAYALLWLLLFAFLVYMPRDKLLFFAIALGSLALLISMKRGAILCLGLAFFYWLILRNWYFPKFNTVVSSMIILTLSSGLFSVFWVTSGEEFTARLSDTSGSGRDIMYLTITNGFIQADLPQLLFGHGSMGVEILTGETIGIREGAQFGLQSHNDWLTLAYDFGIFGVSLFTIMHAALFHKIGRLKTSDLELFTKLRPIHTAIFASSFYSEIFFNTSLIFLYTLLAIMSNPSSYTRMKQAKA